MKTDQAIKIVEGMRLVEQAHLQHIESYEEPQHHRCMVAHCYAEEAREIYERRLHNHRTLVRNAKDRIDALTLALYALGTVRT